MAQTNYTPIQHYRSSTASATPLAANLSVGELAINYADGILFYKDAASVVQLIGRKNPVDTSTSQTLTNKTISAGVFSDGYTEETVTANTGTAYTIDLANGTVQILTLTGNCTFTFPTVTAGRGFTLILKQDATGSRTVTWPSVTNPVKWPSGIAPSITSTASKADKYVFVADGTNWIGSNAGQNYTL